MKRSPKIGLANLVTGRFRDFQGLGTGGVYWAAVDSDVVSLYNHRRR